MAFHPYLNFGGNCREAFTRYHEIFGGDLILLPMSDMPTDQPVAPDQAELIMHAALKIGDDLLMASDAPPAEFTPAQGMYVNYDVAEVSEAERIFAALAEGGQVAVALGKTFWSPAFGVCTDRFGTPWMISAEQPGEASA
jgi:PhnB protein